MPILSDKQIQYGFTYYHKDEPQPRGIVEVSQYGGEASLTINCTQLGDSFTPQYSTAKEKKRVLREWCEFLTANPAQFTELEFVTRMPQELFNAVCTQKNLKKLNIKWGVYPDISAITNLSELEYLHIGSGAGVQSVEPLSKLVKLVALSVNNFQKTTDYTCLTNLKRLESLSICGDGMSPQYIRVDNIDFLKGMPQLRFFRFLTARLRSKDYTPVLSLADIEHLDLSTCNEVMALYYEIRKLPKLKYGLIAERCDLYMK